MSNTANEVLLLYSGGLDSTAAFCCLKKRFSVSLLFIDYNHRASVQEKQSGINLAERYGLSFRSVDLSWYGKLSVQNPLLNKTFNPPLPHLDDKASCLKSAGQVWLPNRNSLFLNIAAAIAEAGKSAFVSAGFNREEGKTFPDNSDEFIQVVQKLFSYSTAGKVGLITPVARLEKRGMVELILSEGLEDVFYSCYSGGKKMCGKCESCLRSLRAFKQEGKLDLIRERFYEIPAC